MADVTVHLEDIDEDNWMEIVLLTTETDGVPKVCEQYVSSNALSIVQAVYEGSWAIKAVYCGKRAVGFTMYGYNPELDGYEICRIMIDVKHQGKGFGTIALKLVMEELMEEDDCEEIYLSLNPSNERGKAIYAKLGFTNTGVKSGTEEIWRFICQR